eukprot:365113-Chlamydomonas_euryale.AAC.3
MQEEAQSSRHTHAAAADSLVQQIHLSSRATTACFPLSYVAWMPRRLCMYGLMSGRRKSTRATVNQRPSQSKALEIVLAELWRSCLVPLPPGPCPRIQCRRKS